MVEVGLEGRERHELDGFRGWRHFSGQSPVPECAAGIVGWSNFVAPFFYGVSCRKLLFFLLF